MSLKVGDWWSIKGTYHWTTTGSGIDSGTFTEDGQYTEKFAVTGLDSNRITISYLWSESWSSTATDVWVEPNGGSTNKDSSTKTSNYVIDLASLNVVDATEGGKDWIGYPVWFLVNPADMKEGGTIQRGAWVPSADAKSDAVKLVDWSIGKPQPISIKGQTVSAWSLSYTGQRLGYWYYNYVYSEGPQTDSRLFDSVYGIFLGISSSGDFRFDRQDGGWKETYSETSQIDDTNLAFLVPVTVNADTPNVVVKVDGASYSSSQLPKSFAWDSRSTHTLQVDQMIQGAPGVRYVFVQWSDGSTETSHTVTVTQALELTATFKTQYELKVISDYGNPMGSGWYDAGTEATFSVASPQPETGFFGSLGGKRVFETWTGDSNANSASATVKMDSAKTVQAQWSADYNQPYLLLGAIGAAIVIAIVVAMKRGMKRQTSEAEPVAKFCVKCGSEISRGHDYCPQCGQKIE